MQVHVENVYLCKIVQRMCAALSGQMVDKATIKVLYPVVESIKALTVGYIHSPQSCCQSKTFGYYSLQKLQGSYFQDRRT